LNSPEDRTEWHGHPAHASSKWHGHLARAGKTLVFGHRGMLGRVVASRPGVIGLDLPECDITDPDAVKEAVQRERPAVIINCAAYTRVDDAEADEALATRVNGDAVGYLAEAARHVDAYFLTLSTDYVFSGQGQTPWREADAPEPQSAYGRSKLAGEKRVQEVGGRWAIVRTQWLYGEGGPNFIDTIARLAAEKDTLSVVNDQIGAPTWANDLAGVLWALAERRAEGVFHAANSGYASWFDVACRVFEQLELDCKVTPCSSEEFPRPAKRPRNSRLNTAKLAGLLGAPLRPWQEALDEYLAGRKAAAHPERR